MQAQVASTTIDVYLNFASVRACQLLEHLFGLLRLAHLMEKGSKIVEGHCVLWLSFENFIEAFLSIFEVVDVLVSKSLIVYNGCAIVIIERLVIASESITKLTITKEKVAILLETYGKLELNAFVNGSLTEHFSEAVDCQLVLFDVHVDCSHQNLNLFFLNQLQHISIGRQAISKYLKPFIISF